MSQRLWLLVEWIDEDDVFPSFGIVHIDRFAYRGSDISPGKEILLRVKVNETRRAKIIRVADNRQTVVDQKIFLEQHDQRVNYALEKFMRRIDALQSEQQQRNQPARGACPVHNTTERKNVPIVILAKTDEDDSNDQDVLGFLLLLYYLKTLLAGGQAKLYRSKTTVPSYNNKPPHSAHASQSNYQRVDLTSGIKQGFSPALTQRRPSMISSTPLPDSRQQGSNSKLCFDQGTQTDSHINQPTLKEIEEMEAVLLKLYKRYQLLVDHAKNGHREEESEETDTSSTVDDTTQSNNSSSVEENTIEVNNTQQNAALPRQMPSTSTVKVEEPGINNAENQSSNVTKVRRMSAQTTDSLDLVPIGDGHAMIPARVLNEIDFRSYTTATRQLLQAIFSRQILATHSLTGRQSPAHANKPPKKILDPKLVNDIVKTVVNRCGVSTSLARNCITVKCTDEAKLYRNRRTNRERRQRKHHKNDENIMPSSHTSSDEFN